MAMAIGLLVLLAFTVIFHFVSPWWFTPIASNWSSMDDTIVLTFWVTGLVFIAITIFMIYCVIKYRYSENKKAAYEPEHKGLEAWLVILTTIGVIILLAPGLKVWNDFINVPDDAHEVEVVAQQWQWSYRYPGIDGKLGTADIKHINADNPLGVNPDDPNGQDDIITSGSQLHLPIDKPVKVLLRSKDTLHNFYVPQFRAKMDIVPGLVSSIWLTPIREGTFEVLCAELCGVGHYNMRSHVVVESAIAYDTWLYEQPTFASTKATIITDPLIKKGQQVSQVNGCLGCHSIDGSKMLGPTWKDMIGKTEELADGTKVIVDEDYIIESITQPNTKIVKGYPAIMPAANLSSDDIKALIIYMQSLSIPTDKLTSKLEVNTQLNTQLEQTSHDQQLAKQGRKISLQRGCVACHSTDGSNGVGPSWAGLYGSSRKLKDDSTVVADETYLAAAINQPNSQIVKGYSPIMPLIKLNKLEVDALIAFIKENKK
jgi:cytochrome c oxidase subunit 2